MISWRKPCTAKVRGLFTHEIQFPLHAHNISSRIAPSWINELNSMKLRMKPSITLFVLLALLLIPIYPLSAGLSQTQPAWKGR